MDFVRICWRQGDAGRRVRLTGQISITAVRAVVCLCWEDRIRRILGFRERFSASSALTSIIGRHQRAGEPLALPGRFEHGLRKQNMTYEQARTLFRLNLVFSEMFLISDNPAGYSATEMAEYMSAFPVKKKKILDAKFRRGTWTVLFEIDGRQYVLLANLTSKAREFRVEPCLYFDPSVPGFRKYEEVRGLGPYESRCLLRVPSEDWAVAGGMDTCFRLRGVVLPP